MIQSSASMSIRTIHMARPQTQKLPSNFATIEQTEVENPISSGDTVAMDCDIAMVDGSVDEGYHTNHEYKKKGKC